jgi:hypothetical protein
MMTKTVTIEVEDFNELRDSLHQTGLFDMSDCIVEITCSMERPVAEVQKMFSFIKTTINVVDTVVISDEFLDTYVIQLREVDPPYMRGPARRARKN